VRSRVPPSGSRRSRRRSPEQPAAGREGEPGPPHVTPHPGRETARTARRAFPGRDAGPPFRHLDSPVVEAFEEVEHRPVLVFEQPARDLYPAVGRHADEVLVVGPAVNRAEAQAVGHDGFAAGPRIADDVGGVEQASLLEPADRALRRVGGNDTTSKARGARGLSPLERRTGARWRLRAARAPARRGTDHRSLRDESSSRGRFVADDEAGEVRLVPTGSGPDEVTSGTWKENASRSARLSGWFTSPAR
jgi:hypothetical protein